MEAVNEETASEAAEPQEKVDVFAFLVKEEDDEADDERPCLADNDHAKDVPVFDDDHEHDHDADPSSQSLHSDSGISMDDINMSLGQVLEKPTLPTVREEPRPVTSSEASTYLRSEWRWPDVPRPSQLHVDSPIIIQNGQGTYYPGARRDSSQYVRQQSPMCFTPATPEYTRTPPLDVQHVVTTLEQGGIDMSSLPMRQFKAIDGRILLHMQHEIYQLEQELSELDVAISAGTEAEQRSASSRRSSWQWNQPHLLSARAEIMQRLQGKIEVYYEHVLLSQKVDRLGGQGIAVDENFQRLLASLDGDTKGQASLLQTIFRDTDDLISRSRTDSHSSSICNRYFLAVAVSLTLIFPILTFKIIHSAHNRVLVVAVMFILALFVSEKMHIISSSLGIPVPEGEDLHLQEQELKRWVRIGSALSILLACIG